VIRSETELVLAVYRTQLFNPDDLANVKTIQDGYRVQPLSEFLGQPRPAAGPAIAFIQPLTPETQKASLQFFNLLNFLLTYSPTVSSETAVMERFAKIGIGGGKTLDLNALTPDMKQALEEGMADGWKQYNDFKSGNIDTGKVTSGDMFGTRADLKNNYLYRMAAALLGIYGNSKAEAMYPLYTLDENKEKLDGATGRYTMRFAPGELPPVNAFWSVTMYNLPQSLLVANPLNRYLLNAPMLPQFARDSDGGLTLFIQNQSPGKAKEANWLPAPKGPFWLAMRLYWPKDEAISGRWVAPRVKRVL
jgi:hypothetical protein